MTLLVAILIVQAGTLVALVALWRRLRTPPAAKEFTGTVLRPGVHCYQVTYAYSNGFTKVFRNCEGFHDFTMGFGQSQAPAGVQCVTRAGGTCTAHGTLG